MYHIIMLKMMGFRRHFKTINSRPFFISALVIVVGLISFHSSFAFTLKWFNKDLYNTSGVDANDVDYCIAGATGAQIQAAVRSPYTEPGFTGPEYGDALIDGVPCGVIRWNGDLPNDPDATNKVHFGVLVDMDALPNNGRDVKFSHVVLTDNGNPVAIAPACAKPEVRFLSDNVLSLDVTAPFNNIGITIDSMRYSFVPDSIPLEDLNGANMSIAWTDIPGSENIDTNETVVIDDLTIPFGSTHIIFACRVRFLGGPELSAGHVFFQSAIPEPPTGACLTSQDACLGVMTETDCNGLGGIYQGDYTICTPHAIPTLTEWGLIILAVLLIGWISWILICRRKSTVVRF